MVIAILLTFFAVFLLIGTIYFGITSSQDSPVSSLRRRMRRMAISGGNQLSEELRSDIVKEVPPFELFLSKIPLLRNIEQALDFAGLDITVTAFLCSLVFLSAISGGMAYIFFHKAVWVPVAFVLVILGAFVFLRQKRAGRIVKFTEQLPEVLDMIARSLRSGHSMTSAVELVGQEMENPAGELFKTAYDQQNLGLRISDTLANMTNRVDSIDLRFFVTSVQINSEVGGNLAESLDNLANIIRERLKIRRQVKVYTAQGRMSGYVLGALPFAAYFMMRMMLPKYTELLTTTKEGIIMLVVVLIMQCIGFLVIRKIIDIKI